MPDEIELPEGYSLPPSVPPPEEKRQTYQERGQEIIQSILQLKQRLRSAYFELASLYKQGNFLEEAQDLLKMLNEDAKEPGEKALYLFTLGQVMESKSDFAAAAEYYKQAYALEPADTWIWYFIHNNLGYSLNKLGRYEEGERYCRAAVRIDPGRHNAYKNLGIALEGQDSLIEAAGCYIKAFKTNVIDGRAFHLLQDLLQRSPELPVEHPSLVEEAEKARQAYEAVQKAIRDSEEQA